MRVHVPRSEPEHRAARARAAVPAAADRLLALQRHAGNQAVARHLRSARLARQWNGDAEKAFAALPAQPPVRTAEFAQLFKLIEEYRQVPQTEVSAKTLELLQKIVAQAVLIREQKDVTDEALRRALADVVTAARQEEDMARYRVQRAATAEAFKTGAPSYLNITPEPGGREALATGKEGRYPESLALDQQFRVGAPTDIAKGLDIDISGPGGVIDLLVVSGGHGGVGSIFEGPDPTKHLEADWWKAQAEALAKKNVKAKLIVLDACLSASMVPAFLPLLTADGKVIGYVHSIPQMTMTSEVWAEVVKQGPKEIERIIDARLAALVKEHGASRHGTSLEPTIAVAIYRADRAALHYDEQALDDAKLAGLQTSKEKLELAAMKRALGSQGAKPVTSYGPSIGKPEGGTVVVGGAQAVKRADWGGWLDANYIQLEPTDPAPRVGTSVYDIKTTAEWTVTATDADGMTVTPV